MTDHNTVAPAYHGIMDQGCPCKLLSSPLNSVNEIITLCVHLIPVFLAIGENMIYRNSDFAFLSTNGFEVYFVT